MVVARLEAYVERNVPGLFYLANLKDLIKNESKGLTKKTVIIDPASLFRFDITSHLTIGLYKKKKADVKKIVNEIIACGVNLIVILRGNKSSDLKDWYFKEVSNKIYHENLAFIDVHKLVSDCVKNTFASISHENYKVFCSLKEVHEEVAYEARNCECLAVLGQDSNYLIHEGFNYYISTKTFDIETFNCHIYDKNKLLDHLGLISKQMPLFASLSGNTVIKVYALKTYHRKFPLKLKFLEIAKDIKEIKNPYEELDYIENLTNIPKTLLKKSLDVYFHPEQEKQTSSSVIDKLKKNNQIDRNIHSIIVSKVLKINTRDFKGESSAQLMRHLRRKIYGILLADPDKCVHEYFIDEITLDMDGHPRPFKAYPIPPERDHPGLLVLLTENSPSIDAVKWDLFSKALSCSLKPCTLRHIPPKLLIPVVALHYLHKTYPQLFKERYEIEAFLITFIQVYVDDITSHEGKSISTPSDRSSYLHWNFTACCFAVGLLNDACGHVISNSDSCISNSFDSGWFFYLYEKMTAGASWKSFFDENSNLDVAFATLLGIVIDQDINLFN